MRGVGVAIGRPGPVAGVVEDGQLHRAIKGRATGVRRPGRGRQLQRGIRALVGGVGEGQRQRFIRAAPPVGDHGRAVNSGPTVVDDTGSTGGREQDAKEDASYDEEEDLVEWHPAVFLHHGRRRVRVPHRLEVLRQGLSFLHPMDGRGAPSPFAPTTLLIHQLYHKILVMDTILR